MYIFQHVLLCLGGISLFLLGLRFMSQNMELLTGNKMKTLLSSCTKNTGLCVLTGGLSTAVLQSSVATNVIVIGFVSNGILSFYRASAVIMGTNVGTTITAQLVSLSGSSVFNVTALGGVMVFIGFILGFVRKKHSLEIGNVLMGFGMLFFGLDIISECVGVFKSYQAFCNIFLVDSPILLLLNGILITSIMQSSSAVSSVIIVLASNGLIGFDSATFLILGANIGTCLPVILASLNRSVDGVRTAFFNLSFNLFGTLILFFPLCLFKREISSFFMAFSGGVERQIANFHTFFNLFVTIILLPILKHFTNLICMLIKEERVKTPTKLAVNGVKS